MKLGLINAVVALMKGAMRYVIARPEAGNLETISWQL